MLESKTVHFIFYSCKRFIYKQNNHASMQSLQNIQIGTDRECLKPLYIDLVTLLVFVCSQATLGKGTAMAKFWVSPLSRWVVWRMTMKP